MLLALALAAVLAASLLPLHRAQAIGRGEVTVGESVIIPYVQEKTLDLSDSDVDIVVTPEQDEALRAEADQAALQWVVKMLTLEWAQTPSPDVPYWTVRASELTQKYWYQDMDVSGVQVTQEQLDFLNLLSSYETASALLAASDQEAMDLVGTYHQLDSGDPYFFEDDGSKAVSVMEYRRILKGKIEEIYNDKFSDALTAQIPGNLDVQVEFTVEPLAADGSEDEAFGVDGQSVIRGQLDEPLVFSTIDFGAQDQFYDAVLSEGVDRYVANDLGYAAELNDDAMLLRDGRDFVDHVMFIDGGYLRSSDGSQEGGGVLRGDPKYPGDHCLLEVCDGLNTYRWGRYGIPGAKYTQTFNLHLNPAVTYYADEPTADLITHAQFDEAGRLVSISKPINTLPNIKSLLQSDAFANLPAGTYRYKLKETAVNAGGDLADEHFANDTRDILMDVIVGEESVYNSDTHQWEQVLGPLNIFLFETTDDVAAWQEGLGLLQAELDQFEQTLDAATQARDEAQARYQNGEIGEDERRAAVDAYYDALHAYHNLQNKLSEYSANKHLTYLVNFVNKIANTQASFTKVWDDESDAAGFRPSAEDYASSVHLYAGETEVTDHDDYKTVVDNGDDTYTVTWEHLPKFDADGAEITYTIREDAVAEYDQSASKVDNGGSITNTHEPLKLDVVLTKTWDDAEDQDGLRPSAEAFADAVRLQADGADTDLDSTKQVVDNGDGTYTVTWADLPKHVDGQVVEYTVAEDAIEGYEAGKVSEPEAAEEAEGKNAIISFELTNAHEPATVSFEGSKTWADADDNDGKRPDSITIRLFDGTSAEPVKVIEVTQKDDWKWSFADLPAKKAGKELAYHITEDAVDGYSSAVDGFDVTNSYTPGKTSIAVSKVWSDNDNTNQVRPGAISVRLLADGEDTGKTIGLSEDNKWQGSFSDLPTHAKGKAIEYTVAEDGLPEGYKVTTSGNATQGFVLVNEYIPQTSSEPEPAVPEVVISKTDAATSAELPGARLVITDAATGEVVKEFFSGEQPTTFKLAPGEYTLTELTAPDGYEKAESINFTVDENGLVGSEKVEMKDQPTSEPTSSEPEPVAPEVVISKTDATTSEELPGARLVIVDNATREVVKDFFSGAEPTTFELAPGSYTLIEVTAPDGYEKAESITFTVDENGLVGSEKVEMKDQPTSEPTSSEPEPTSSEPEPASSEPEPASSEPEPTSSEPAPTSSEPEPTSSEPAPTSSEPEKGAPTPATFVPKAVKTLEGNGVVIHENEFKFQLLDESGNVVETAAASAGAATGTATFAPLTFTKPGAYKFAYKVVESIEGTTPKDGSFYKAGVQYDTHESTLSVIVELDEATNALVATPVYSDGEVASFTNTFNYEWITIDGDEMHVNDSNIVVPTDRGSSSSDAGKQQTSSDGKAANGATSSDGSKQNPNAGTSSTPAPTGKATAGTVGTGTAATQQKVVAGSTPARTGDDPLALQVALLASVAACIGAAALAMRRRRAKD